MKKKGLMINEKAKNGRIAFLFPFLLSIIFLVDGCNNW